MRRIFLCAMAAVVALLVSGSAAMAGTPDVHVEDHGACHYVVVNGKRVPQNGLCYLGPPPIEIG
jgi:hypothetical protein